VTTPTSRRRNAAAVVAVFVTVATGCAVNDPQYLEGGQAFVDVAVPAIATTWNADELIARADPAFLQALPEPKARELVSALRNELGPLKQATTQVATVGYNAGGWYGKGAQYVVKLQCEKGTGTLVLLARKPGDQWRILGFHVNIDGKK
jgi:hypothetical protein